MSSTETTIESKVKKETKEPARYKVIMLNDDYTPMEWVQELLVKIFKHSSDTSTDLTMTVHNEGSAVVGVYAYEIAEHKVVESIDSSRKRGFPLTLTLEEE